MLAGTGLTICFECGKTVPVLGGCCVLCGAEFLPSTINVHVIEVSEEKEKVAA